MALAQTDLPELKRFNFFVSRRFEEGRERFRLHMGSFATLAEAEEWLTIVREIYPGAWAGEAPGRKLRERAAAAAAAQAQHAAGPQPHAVTARAAPAAAAHVVPDPPSMRVPVVHAAPAAPPVLSRPVAHPAPRPVAAPPIHNLRPPAAGARAGSSAPARIVPGPAGQRPAPARIVPSPVGQRPARGAGKNSRQVFQDSNVREVLAALADASATGETRQMHAPPAPRAAPPADSGTLSDTQVLRMLEYRRPEGEAPAMGDPAHRGIALLKPDDTATRRALKEAVATNAPVSFAVQLQWSVQPVELDKVPPLAIFSAYTLYTVEGSRDGRKWYGLRLGFFSDAISAKQVAHYVRSEFGSVAVVPVSPQERARASEQDKDAKHAAPSASRPDRSDEFKLLDDDTADIARAALLKSAGKPHAAAPSAKTAKPPAGRAPRQPPGAPVPPAAVRGRPRGVRVGARERRGPQTLEETLEILGASQLTIDNGTGETLNDTGVRHLRVQVQKNSPFSRLLERLSERIRKP